VKTFYKNFREQLARVIRLIRRSKRNIRPTLTPSGREFLRKAEEFVRKVRIKVRGDGDNEMSIAFPNGSRIVGLAGNEVTARGYSASLLLIDEAARVDDRFVSGDASVTGGGEWGSVADEYTALWEARLLLGRVGTRRRGVGAYLRVGATECSRISPQLLAEESAKGDETCRQEYMYEFGEIEGAVFSRESIEAALQDFEPLSL
jgi:hypothetical protein